VPDYSIWIVEYARVEEYPVSWILYGARNEGNTVLPYCYAVLQSDEHLIVVDSGFNMADYGEVLAKNFGVSHWQPPKVVLGRLGFDPDDVDTVILTHNHFDHAGGVDLFPNAHVFIQHREISHYLWAKGLPDRLQFITSATDPDLVMSLVQRMKDGKLTLTDGEAELRPGIIAHPAFETHTDGSQYITVENAHDGRWVMAGDNMYVYENVTGRGDGRYIPIGYGMGSLEKGLLLTEEMFTAVDERVERMVPFHALEMWDRFPSQRFDDTLHIAELSLRPGDHSRLTMAASAG
jgi:glyoxylase-like metal-dependent hydrolase (beta-lactamase superfamily II)